MAAGGACTSYAACNYTWLISGWSSCTSGCGNGTQSRTVTCRRSDDCLRSDGTQVANGSCSGTAPTTSQSCLLGACNSSCVQLGVDVRTLTQTASQYTRPRCGDASGSVCETSGVIPSGFRLATQAEGLSPRVGFGTCALWTEGCWYWTGSGSVLTCTHVVSGCRTAGCTIGGGFCYTAALLVRQGLIGTCLR